MTPHIWRQLNKNRFIDMKLSASKHTEREYTVKWSGVNEQITPEFQITICHDIQHSCCLVSMNP